MLVHTRLAIIDPEQGAQPISDPSGRWWLSYNGEIYNYRELRPALAEHWQFQTQCDSEVLLAGLLTHGTAFLNQLNGMWAFALWDSKQRELMLCRDRVGKKPLYYAAKGSSIACASEIPALCSLLEHSELSTDLDTLADILRYGSPLPGHTPYSQIKEVLPGSVLCWDADGRLNQKQYWSLPQQQERQPSEAEAAETTWQLLESAVAYRLVADVPVASLLSGGIDSTIVSSLASATSRDRLLTFSMGFADPRYDESQYALKAARHIGSEHHQGRFDIDSAETMSGLIANHLGMPFADASLLPTAAIAQFVSSKVKVALTGDGADEVFGGYQRYLGQTLLRWYSRLPKRAQRSIEAAVAGMPEPLAHHSKSLIKKAKLFVRLAQQASSPAGSAYVAPRYFSDAEIALLAPDLGQMGHRPPQLSERAHPDDLMQMLRADALCYLPQDILIKADRAAMAHSVEFRSPFLDYRLIEHSLSLTSKLHLGRSGLRSKNLLRRRAASVVPEIILRRRKQGFSVPVGSWFKTGLQERLAALFSTNGPNLLSGATVQALVNDHLQGRVDHGQRLWLLLTLGEWMKSQEYESARIRSTPKGIVN